MIEWDRVVVLVWAKGDKLINDETECAFNYINSRCGVVNCIFSIFCLLIIVTDEFVVNSLKPVEGWLKTTIVVFEVAAIAICYGVCQRVLMHCAYSWQR